MNLKKTLQLLLTIVAIIIFYSCNSSDTATKDESKKRLNSFQEDWKKMRSNSNKLIIRRYYLNPDSNIIRCVNCQTWSDSTTEEEAIAGFNQFFNDIQDYGYCWPSLSHFSVIFFRDTIELGKYFVDTLTTKGKAKFFDGGYQTSFFIETRDWNAFLTGHMDYH